MAIKIETTGVVKLIQPESKAFSLREINDYLEGFVEPVRIGPIWVMYEEKAAQKGFPLNEIASFFFNVAMHGTVLIVPPQQLPLDWEVLEEDDLRYSASDVDNGFLLSLQRALIRQRVYGDSGNTTNVEGLMYQINPQEEYSFRPPDTICENTIDFYQQVYDYITQNPESFKKNVLLSEPTLLIKLEDEHSKEKMINQMLEYYVSVEEYEKCAKIKQLQS